jgi:beta-lactamase class D
MYTFDENIVSDLHKDAYGYRPDAYFWEEWNQCGDNTRQAMWDNLLVELEQAREREAQEQIASINAFELEIANALDVGARSREDAVRWIVQGLELSDIDMMYGGSYICFLKGLPYRMAAMFDNAINFFRAEVV